MWKDPKQEKYWLENREKILAGKRAWYKRSRASYHWLTIRLSNEDYEAVVKLAGVKSVHGVIRKLIKDSLKRSSKSSEALHSTSLRSGVHSDNRTHELQPRKRY